MFVVAHPGQTHKIGEDGHEELGERTQRGGQLAAENSRKILEFFAKFFGASNLPFLQVVEHKHGEVAHAGGMAGGEGEVFVLQMWRGQL